jgi:hypothetical protein
MWQWSPDGCTTKLMLWIIAFAVLMTLLQKACSLIH